MGKLKKKKISSGNRCELFVLAHCLLTGKAPAADPSFLSLGDPGMCGISNTENEAPKYFSL